MKLLKIAATLAVITIFTSSIIAQQAIFEKEGEIPVPAIENAGFGNVIAGVDLDGDGMPEVYAVNNMYDLGGAEAIPRIYKFEWNGASWDSVWGADAPLTAQNTWPALTYGDLDGDGRYELIWGPVNNFAAGVNPSRVLVYEDDGNSSDNAMGVDDGTGHYLPNAKWTILPDSSNSEQLRPFRWEVTDIDNDGQKDLVFGSRRGDRRFGVIDVSDIPNNGDSSETWTLMESGLSDSTFTFGSGTIYDMVTVDSTIYLFHSGGDVTAVTYNNGTWATTVVTDAVPGGSWKSAQVVDIDGDGTMEIMVAGWTTGNNQIYVLQVDGANITTNAVFNAANLIGASGRFYGGGAGDTDGDGMLDYVTGTRGAKVNGMMVQLSYKGGDITDPANYYASVIDQDRFDAGRYGLIGVGDVNNDGNDEVLYASDWKGNDSGTPPYRVPLTVLNHVLTTESIANARVDANGDFVPDRMGDSVTVSGVVTSTNFGSGLQYFIQDATGGIQLFNFSSGVPLNVGDFVVAKGTVDQFHGLDEVAVADPTMDIMVLDSNVTVPATKLTVDEYMSDPETYEGQKITITGVAPTATSVPWPASGSNANITLWNGSPMNVTMRVDKDTDLDENAEPSYPINVTGIATQFASGTPPNDGYQITPSFYADIAQGISVAPSPYFSMVEPADSSVIALNDSSDSWTFSWNKPVDLNGDALIYQVVMMFPDTTVKLNATDTSYVLTAPMVLDLLKGDTVTVDVKWTVLTTDNNEPAVTSNDTSSFTLVNNVLVGVEDQSIPTKFFVDQNYPNPFNPTTTIKFGLPSDLNVDLRVYDILGQEVKVLMNNQLLRAGVHVVNFNASQLASGTYIYRLKAGNSVTIKKMMLLK